MKVILLAGGLGTRLREETEFRPKPMVEVGGRPILWHIMKHLSTYDVCDFIVATGYKAEMIEQYFLHYDARSNDFTIQLGSGLAPQFHGDHQESNWSVTLADTGPDTLTGGRVLRASKYLVDERFMVVYGDGVANVDVAKLLEFHEAHGRLATATVAQPTSRYGVVDLDDDGLVSSFSEKPSLEGWINIGFFVFEPEVLKYLDSTGPLETDPLSRLAADGQLAAFRHSGFWQPMDTYRESQMLNSLWDAGSAPWQTW
jgi:glucose-1-phosphate cytidylyltransferase